jgi:hypothetical protein
MKKHVLLLAILAFGFGFAPLHAQRYLTEVFTDVNIDANVTYGVNISVLTGTPAPDTLRCDIYTPVGDSLTARPTVLIAHTGSFLPPPLNGQCTGNKNDSVNVEMCRRFARRGFTAVSFNYRLGWNPVSSDQDVRTSTLINAAYRGIQDAFNLIRFLRADAASANSYGVDVNGIVVGGIGTGGYIGLGANFLDDINEIYLDKFYNFSTNAYYVDTSLSGDIYGTVQRPLNIPNVPTMSNDFAMGFNLGGALGDKSWIDANGRPHVSFHVPSDPFAPYDSGAVIVPTTGDFVVAVTGSRGSQEVIASLGLNSSFANIGLSDPFTVEADTKNEGFDGLFPFYRPGVESGPWEYYDTTVCNQPNPTNPDMSQLKSNTYIDSVMGYLAPRIVCGLGLAECADISTAIDNELELGAVSVFPNPSTGLLNLRSTVAGNHITSVRLTDIQGRSVITVDGLNDSDYTLDHQGVSPGLYFIRVNTRKGYLTKKVVLQ